MIDVVLGFPDRVVRRPERYAMPRDKREPRREKAELQRVLASELATRKFLVSAQRWLRVVRESADYHVGERNVQFLLSAGSSFL